jgi:hypothetical protein
MYVNVAHISCCFLIGIQLCCQRSSMWWALQAIWEVRLLGRLHKSNSSRLISTYKNLRTFRLLSMLKTNTCARRPSICVVKYGIKAVVRVFYLHTI